MELIKWRKTHREWFITSTMPLVSMRKVEAEEFACIHFKILKSKVDTFHLITYPCSYSISTFSSVGFFFLPSLFTLAALHGVRDRCVIAVCMAHSKRNRNSLNKSFAADLLSDESSPLFRCVICFPSSSSSAAAAMTRHPLPNSFQWCYFVIQLCQLNQFTIFKFTPFV